MGNASTPSKYPTSTWELGKRCPWEHTEEKLKARNWGPTRVEKGGGDALSGKRSAWEDTEKMGIQSPVKTVPKTARIEAMSSSAPAGAAA